jgi:hypothetical protein
MQPPAPASLKGLAASIFERGLERIERMRQELAGLERDYAERDDLPGTQVSLRALLLIVGETERVIVTAGRERASGKISESAFRKTMASHMRTLEGLVPDQLSRVRRAHGRDLEPLVAPLTRMAGLIGPEQHLIFDPVDRYEIELSDDRRWLTKYAEQFSEDLLEALRALPTISILSYPALLEGEMLQHLLFGHEMGHLALARKIGNTTMTLRDAAFLEAVIQNSPAIKQQLGATTSDSARDIYRAEQELRDRLKKWFTELACDQIGIRVAGPGFLLALHDFAALRDTWVQRQGIPGFKTHPGLAWRLERLLPEARRFLDTKRTTKPWRTAREVVTRIESEIPPERDEITEVERKIIIDALESLDEYLGDLPKGIEYDVGDFERLFDVVWEKLDSGIPPAEEILKRSRPDASWLRRRLDGHDPADGPPDPWSQPMDWRAILNGGYFYWYGNAGEQGKNGHLPINPKRIEERASFNTLLRGSVELSEMQFKLQEVKDELYVMSPPRSDS